MKNLGVMNGWYAPLVHLGGWDSPLEKMGEDTVPPEYTACREAGHVTVETPNGRCYTTEKCEICGIFWSVDSSD